MKPRTYTPRKQLRNKAQQHAREQKAFDQQTERIATNPRSQANVIAAYRRNQQRLNRRQGS